MKRAQAQVRASGRWVAALAAGTGVLKVGLSGAAEAPGIRVVVAGALLSIALVAGFASGLEQTDGVEHETDELVGRERQFDKTRRWRAISVGLLLAGWLVLFLDFLFS